MYVALNSIPSNSHTHKQIHTYYAFLHLHVNPEICIVVVDDDGDEIVSRGTQADF